MQKTTGIRFLGWSNIIIDNEEKGSLAFDPFFRPFAGANWARIEDYADVRIICISHGHAEHYLDTPRVVKYTDAVVISSQEVCDHLHSRYKIPRDNLVAVSPFQEVKIRDFKITAFTWYHRKINYWKFFKGNLFTGLYFAGSNLLRCPYDAPYYGYFIETPDGYRIMNYTEGLNTLLPTEEAESLGKKFHPHILIGGMQLNYEDAAARAAAAISPEVFILYHPHEKMFQKMKIASTPSEVFVAKIKGLAPDVQVLLPEDNSFIKLPVGTSYNTSK